VAIAAPVTPPIVQADRRADPGGSGTVAAGRPTMSMPADIKAYNRQLIEEFRSRGGPPDGRPLLLLTTTGRRTGRRHTTPVMRLVVDGRDAVVASNNGAPRHPDWFHNLVADPDVTVEVAGETYPARAVVPEGAERDRIWAQIVAAHPFFAEHQSRANPRTIPVVVLERRPTTEPSG
jgi:deazaflavin-dependent oxidoreductase (nitroreductase family)